MTDSRSFFVSEDGSSASPPTTTPTAPQWGYEKRTCDACGADWGQMACTRGGCTSISFTVSYVPPVPFLTRIQEKLAPKAKPVRASPAQLERHREVEADIIALLAKIHALEAEDRDAVVVGVEELQWPQALLHRAVSTQGDRSTRNIDGLCLSLESAATYLGIAIKNIEENHPT